MDKNLWTEVKESLEKRKREKKWELAILSGQKTGKCGACDKGLSGFDLLAGLCKTHQKICCDLTGWKLVLDHYTGERKCQIVADDGSESKN